MLLTNREMNTCNTVDIEQWHVKKVSKDLLLVLAISLFIGFLAPFGMNSFPVYLSFAYWVITCLIGYFIYAPIVYFFNKLTVTYIKKEYFRVGIATLLASIVMALTIPVVIWIFFDIFIDYRESFLGIFSKTIVIGTVITIVHIVLNHNKQQKLLLVESEKKLIEKEQLSSEKSHQGTIWLMQQLPIEKRGKLLCLEMSDHYLKVYTEKGHHLVLMRFKDVLARLNDDKNGMQTHRSWWVALDAIEKVEKVNRKVSLLLTNQVHVPVSRTYLTNVKGALAF